MSRRKKKTYGKLFRLASIAVIIICCAIYGYRLVKYYKIYNPKTTEKNGGLLSISIPKNSPIVTSGSGLYHIGGSYIYKGNVDNNYVSFSGFTFRILKMTYGGNVELILDDAITSLAYNKDYTSFDKADINKYLNTQFIELLNKDLLEKSSVCLDKVSNLSLYSKECKNSYNNDYVKLLDINTYLNTINDGTYLNDEESYLWLSNVSDNTVWNANGYNISSSLANAYYKVKPVITLDSEVELLGGSGKQDDPYRIDTIPDYSIGSYVKLDDDVYRIIKNNKDTITLELNGVINKLYKYGTSTQFDLNDKYGLAYYLNNEYYQSLSYKDLIIKTKYSAGQYDDSISSISDYVDAYVVIPSVTDFQFNTGAIQYYLLNYYDNKNVFCYDTSLRTCGYANTKSIKPVITINKDVLKSGNGTLEVPYSTEG